MAESIPLNEVLIRMGVSWLTGASRARFVSMVEDDLELRVGQRLSLNIPLPRADFETMFDEDPEGASESFLKEYVPDYSRIVLEEIDAQIQEFIAAYEDDRR